MPAQKPKKPVQAVAKTKTAAKAAPAKAKPVAKAAAKPAATTLDVRLPRSTRFMQEALALSALKR